MKYCEICSKELINADVGNVFEKNGKIYLLCKNCMTDVLVYLYAEPLQVRKNMRNIFQNYVYEAQTKERKEELSLLFFELFGGLEKE